MTTKTRTTKTSWIRGIDDADLKKHLTEKARIGPSAPLSGKGFVFMRPTCQGPDCPDGTNGNTHPGDPCKGNNFVWQPNLAAAYVYIPPYPNPNQDCPSEAYLANIAQAVRRYLGPPQFPDPDVRVTCKKEEDTGNNPIITIFVWPTRPVTRCDELSRSRADVPAKDILKGGDCGIYIDAGFIRLLANDEFDALDKTYDAQGHPNDHGPIHLTGLSLGFKQPNIIETNIIETYVTGYDERPWPSVSFTLVLTDKLDAPGQPCTTDSRTDLDTVDVIEASLLGGLLLALTAFGGLHPFPLFVLSRDFDALLNQPHSPPTGGAGCGVIQALEQHSVIPLPTSVGIDPAAISTMVAPRVNAGAVGLRTEMKKHGGLLPPERNKLVITYNRPRVDERGVFVSASCSTEPRTPRVQIIGPSKLTITPNRNFTFGNYSADAEEFFGKLSFSWSGDGVISSPNLQTTRISFPRSKEPGQSFEQTIILRATDIEGSSAMASLTVSIYVADVGDNLPPICQNQPWREECQRQQQQ